MTYALWDYVQENQSLDPRGLAEALRTQLKSPVQDPRLQQLACECAALLKHWNVSAPDPPFDPPEAKIKFPSLARRIELVTTREAILQFLRDLGSRLRTQREEVRVVIGGSSSLILDSLLQRQTDDVDLVDEVPASIRALGPALREAEAESHLHLAHFQSHYLPDGWESRTESLGRFGVLSCARVDSLDVFVGKLFSKRTKDRADLRFLQPAFDRPRVEERLARSANRLAGDPLLRANAEHNWYVLYGDELPLPKD